MVCCSFVASSIDKLPSLRKPQPETMYESRWLSLKRGTIRYVSLGKNDASDTIILMPDPPNTIEHMSELINLLSKKFKVVIFEGLGFGYSTANMDYDFSIEHNAEVMLELLHKLEIKRAILALTCVAALAGLWVANKYPERIKGIVLGQTPSLDEAKRWAKRIDFKGLIGTPFLGQILLKLFKGRISDLWYENALARGKDRHFFIDNANISFKNGARFSLASGLQSLLGSETDAADLIARQKSIVLWGNLDRSHRSTNKYFILDFLPNGKIVELEKCAHFPDVEAPEAFAEAIEEVALEAT